MREERDSNGDGYFDLRLFYENGELQRQEADTNGDRRVDVWVKFEHGERIEQLEDQKFQGKITARYVFKGGELAAQEQVADGDPPFASLPFVPVEQELQSMAGNQR